MIFFILMICVDVLMLLHRMIKAIGTGKLLLYGYPIYMDARDHRRKMHFSFMYSKISKNFLKDLDTKEASVMLQKI